MDWELSNVIISGWEGGKFWKIFTYIFSHKICKECSHYIIPVKVKLFTEGGGEEVWRWGITSNFVGKSYKYYSKSESKIGIRIVTVGQRVLLSVHSSRAAVRGALWT